MSDKATLTKSKRFRQIVSILSKYGLADWLDKTDFRTLKDKLHSKTGHKISKLSYEEKIRYAITDLGTTFIKFGQILSTRPDLVSDELAKELEKLQANTPADGPEYVVKTVEETFGKPISELYKEFDTTALASASIGQVHKATLLDGTEVVVKIKHEGIDAIVREDLELLKFFAGLVERFDSRLKNFQPVATIKSFSRTLEQELDLRREANNLTSFIANFKKDDKLKFPTPYKELSSKNVLTMEFLKGSSVAKLKEQSPLAEEDAKAFVHKGASMYLDMIFRDGFYHADPHPGNIFYLEGGIVGVIDAGMVGRINDRLRDQFEALLLSLLEGDVDQLIELVMEMGVMPSTIDIDSFKDEMQEFGQYYLQTDVKELDTSEVLTSLTDVLRKYNIILPADFSMLIKVLIEIDGLVNSLTKEFNLTELLKPYYIKATVRRYSPKEIFKKARVRIRDWTKLIEHFPSDVRHIISGIRNGSLSVNLEIKGLEKSVNRLVLGLLCAALFLGSTSLVTNFVPPLYNGNSIIGMTGTILAFALGVYLIFDIIRKK